MKRLNDDIKFVAIYFFLYLWKHVAYERYAAVLKFLI